MSGSDYTAWIFFYDMVRQSSLGIYPEVRKVRPENFPLGGGGLQFGRSPESDPRGY